MLTRLKASFGPNGRGGLRMTEIVWRRLYIEHVNVKERPNGEDDPGVLLRRRIKGLAEQRRVSAEAPHRVRSAPREKGGTLHECRGIKLCNVREYPDALLSMSVRSDRRGNIIEYAILVETPSSCDSPETAHVIAVHLSERPQGAGACGHALLHCHVGRSLELAPKVRVPLPAMTPWDALDWLLTQVVPAWPDPTPWPDEP